MKKKSTLIVSILILSIFLSNSIQGQELTYSKVKNLDNIINQAINNVSHFIKCKTNLGEKIPPSNFLVFLHRNRDKGSYYFSVEPFPVDIRTIQSVSMMGYYKYKNNFVFIATEKEMEFPYPNLIVDNLPEVVDSLMNRYRSLPNLNAVVVYYYYLFSFKYHRLFTKNVKLHYKFYPSFECVPIDHKSGELVYENDNVKFLDYSRQGSIFFYCGEGYLHPVQKKILREGGIKINLNSISR